MKTLGVLLLGLLCSCASYTEDERMEHEQRYAEAIDHYHMFRAQCIASGGVVIVYGHAIDEKLAKGKRVPISDLRGARCSTARGLY